MNTPETLQEAPGLNIYWSLTIGLFAIAFAFGVIW